MNIRIVIPLLMLITASLPSHAAEVPHTPAVTFGKRHGFYDAPVSVSLSVPPGNQIRYTIDGISPSKDRGEVYTNSIEIRQTTVLRAVAVSSEGQMGPVITQTYIFPKDVLTQSQDGKAPRSLPANWGRARVDYGMDARIVDAPPNGDQMVPALKSLPSYSLVLNPDDLFGARRGVYSNPEREGRSAERPASLELIDPKNHSGFQINCGVRIRGGVSSDRMNPKHGFRIFFRKEYGPGALKYPVFGTNAAQRFDSFDLRCAQNHSWHMENEAECLFIRDQFNRDLQAALGQPSARGDFCHLYLNGQYWGLYDTCERPEASYAAAYFGGSKTNYDVIKTHGVGGDSGRFLVINATDGDDRAWRRLHTLAKAGLSDNAAYFRLLGKTANGADDPKEEVLLDPVNLVDYMLLIFYSGNYDAPVTKFFGNSRPNNWHGIRKKDSRDGFKFFIWDAEHTLLQLGENRLGPFPAGARFEQSNPQWIWQQCLANPEFRILVADRIQKHFYGNGALTPSTARALFDRRIGEIEAAVLCESARWGDSHPGRPSQGWGRAHRVPFTRDDWRIEVKRMREQYLPQRSGIVLKQLQRADLVASLGAPQIVLAPGDLRDGTRITMRAEGDAIIYYTLDGSDPRAIGGKVQSSAKTGSGPVAIPIGAVAKARAKSGKQWSALVEQAHPGR